LISAEAMSVRPSRTGIVSRACLLAATLAGLSGCGSRGEETALTIEQPPDEPAQVRVRLEGDGADELRRRVGEDSSQSRVEPYFYLALKGSRAGTPSVPMLARLVWTEDGALLLPQAALTPGRTYEAVFDGPRLGSGPRITRDYAVPENQTESDARVLAVYPSQAEVPANLLKFYVHFSRPMAQGQAFRHARLLDAAGKPVAQAFHQVELWDEEHRRLTLLVNPGRTKRALGLSESLGPVLEESRSYTLEITAGLRDQKGRPLALAFRHPLRTAGFDRNQPRIESWTVRAPRSGAREPLVVEFPEPMDHALASRLLQVETSTGAPLDGTALVDAGSTRWRFTPAAPWQPGRYVLSAGGELEDLAGNSLWRPFETPWGSGHHPTPDPPRFRRGFAVD